MILKLINDKINEINIIKIEDILVRLLFNYSYYFVIYVWLVP